MPSEFNYTKINLNEATGVQWVITSTITYTPKCNGSYKQIRLINQDGGVSYEYDDYESETELEVAHDFLTWFKHGEYWVLVDARNRRDSKKAQYKDFCIDGYFSRGVHTGSIAFFCELPEDEYCQENDCFQHCCPHYFYFDIDKGICEQLPEANLDEWKNEFNATLPHNDLYFKNVTNFYGQDINNLDLVCDEDDDIIHEDTTYNLIKYMPNGKLDFDGAIIPFGKHCYNQDGKN